MTQTDLNDEAEQLRKAALGQVNLELAAAERVLTIQLETTKSTIAAAALAASKAQCRAIRSLEATRAAQAILNIFFGGGLLALVLKGCAS